jgi:glycosyltransferase involved in cell wall biosynthesis
MANNLHLLFLASYAPSTERPRAYNMLRGLARHFRVSLIAQVRSLREREAVEAMRAHCDFVEAVPLSRRRALANCLLHLATPTPLRAAYFFNPNMNRAIARRLAAEHYDLVHVEHLMAAHFAVGLRGVVRSFDTIDSIARLQEKILRMARSPLDRLLSLEELPKVRRYEPRLCRRFDCVLTSTELDREALGMPNVRVVPNGVDLDYYKGGTGILPVNAKAEPDTIVFYGRLSYIANAEAIGWFLREIFPRILAGRPSARLLVVGPSPPVTVRRAASENVIIAGHVPDVRPYLQRACVVVCPIRFAVGTQNKILEPMAMGIPVVATSEAIAGMAAEAGRDLLVGDDPGTFARAVVRLLGDDALRALIARRALDYVRTHHDWRVIVDDLATLYRAIVAQRIKQESG